MQSKKSFLDRYGKYSEAVDEHSRRSYVARLLRERSLFESTLGLLDEGVLLIDQDFRIKYFNRAAQVLLGLPEDIAKLRMPQVIQSVEWERLAPHLNGVFERVARQEVELDYPAHRTVGMFLYPMVEAPELALVIFQDRTEINRSRMDGLDKGAGSALSLLASSVAHEIGNPLNNIYLNLQLLGRNELGAEGAMSPMEVCELIENCKGEVERLEQIVTQFLSAMRPGSAAFAKVDLRQTLLDTLKMLQPEIENRRIELSCELPDGLPMVSGDGGLLKQAFYNILKNALQATSAGGSIEISAISDGEFLSVVFADSGNGIDSTEINRIFTPYTTFKADGNGLGLFIVDRICREHGAELSIDSRKGSGTAVIFKFRLRPRAPKAIPPPA